MQMHDAHEFNGTFKVETMDSENTTLECAPVVDSHIDEMRRTRDRISSFRASLRLHAQIVPKDIGPMAISIHNLPGYFSGIESTDQKNQKSSSQRFIRNAIMGTALMAAGIWAFTSHPGALGEAQSFYEHTMHIQPSLTLVEKPKLDNTAFILANDLSKFSATDVRQSLNYVNVTYNGEDRKTLDVPSRLLLSKWASDNSGLESVGLNWKVLYGFIHAESTWVPQEGVGKNGVKSHGLAQFEGATARSYGLSNAYDPLAAVSAAAALIKDAAYWTKNRLVKLPMGNADQAQQAQALREGVSVFYNTGWKTRHAWSPMGSHPLPDATKTHIINVKAGNMIADNLVADIKAGNTVSTPSVAMQNDAVKRAEKMISSLRLTKAKLSVHNQNGYAGNANSLSDAEKVQRAQLAKQAIPTDNARLRSLAPGQPG